MKIYIPWLTAAAILVIVFGTIYVTVQQSQRLNANWPQIQIAEDTAAALNSGARPASLTSGRVSLNSSLAPFVIIYDKSGHVVSGSGYLNGHIPQAPTGSLLAAAGEAYNFVTWQPENDVRIAAVTTSANNYYVLSGRSLKEVERNAGRTFGLAFLGGVLSWIVLGAGYLAYQSKKK
jgi:hypothetical protein